MPPPKRQDTALDELPGPVSGVSSAATLATTRQPPWAWRARAVREGLAKDWERDGRPPTSERFLNRPTPGKPPPPVSAIGDPKLVARHAYKWEPKTTMAAHFRPDRHSVMIHGRPMQARGG